MTLIKVMVNGDDPRMLLMRVASACLSTSLSSSNIRIGRITPRKILLLRDPGFCRSESIHIYHNCLQNLFSSLKYCKENEIEFKKKEDEN